MRRSFVGSVVVAVMFSGLSVIPEAVLPAAWAGSVVPEPDPDVPSSPTVPLQGLLDPVDPAATSDPLRDELSDLPTDEVSQVEAEPVWTEVPAMPVEVKVPEGSLPEPPPTDPTDSPTDNSTEELTDEPTTDPTEAPTDIPTDKPTDEPVVPVEPEVEVAWDKPSDLTQGVALLSVTPAEAPVDPMDAVVDGVGVRVDYSDFDEVYGAGWADRLVVRAYPACYAETPEFPECSAGVQVPSSNNTNEDLLRFTTISLEELQAALDAAGADSGAAVDPEGEDPAGDDPGSTDTEGPDAAPRLTDELVPSGTADLRVQPAVSVARTTTAAATDPSGGGVVYAVGSAPGGYGAVPVSPSGEWQVGPGSGEFSYSYGFTAPPSVAGPAPSLGLAYSSGAVDGMTTTSSGQASPAGVGWSLEPGFISRSYRACSEDGDSAEKDDFCWRTDGDLVEDLTLSLNGQVSRLVKAENGDRWRLKADPGWRIERIRGKDAQGNDIPGVAITNDDNDEEAFLVTTPDGTKYWFGLGKGGTDSVWTVPVFGNHSGEPCHATPGWCQQGWRWNLDRVIDPSGNVTKYLYASEQNHYQRWAGGDPVTREKTVYDRGGLLTRVAYGVNNPGTGADAAPMQVIDLTSTKRCLPQLSNPSASCPGVNEPGGVQSDWPDVPGNLVCEVGDTCNEGLTSPAFFTTRRYHKVVTKVWESGTGLRPVDTWELTHSMPDPDGEGGSQADLWLVTIQRTGHLGNQTKSLPDMRFTSVPLANKIVAAGEETHQKYRIGQVRNETGGRLKVTYGHADGRNCTYNYVHPSGDRDRWGIDKECFGIRYKDNSNQLKTDWFHKWLVTRIEVGDNTLGLELGSTGGGSRLGKVGVYDYEYLGAPAWRFAGSPNAPTDLESWTDWRGYEATIIHTRATTDEETLAGNGHVDVARQKIVRFRGMHKAPKNPTEVNQASLPRDPVRLDTVEYSVTSDEPFDHNFLEGLTAESSTLKPNGDLIARTYTAYESIKTATVGGEHPRVARVRYPVTTKTTTQLYNAANNPTGTRSHQVTYTYYQQGSTSTNDDGDGTDPAVTAIDAGAPRSVFDPGEPGTTADDTCTLTLYEASVENWIRVPVETRTINGACPAPGDEAYDPEDPDQVDDLLTRSTVVYDDGNALARGLPTSTHTWTTPSGVIDSNPADQTDTEVDVLTTRTSYDTYGRVKSTVGPGDGASASDTRLTTNTLYNGDNTVYAPVTNLRVTQVDVLGEAQQTHSSGGGTTTDSVTITTLDPGRGVPLTVTDPNGGVTRITYNELGQPVEVRDPGQGPGDPASVEYTYTPTIGTPSKVRTRTLRQVNGSNVGTYDDSYTFYDGWGREVETHVPQPETPADRIAAITGYDERGLVRYSMPNVANTDDYGTTVVNPALSTVAQYTETGYDGAGRPTTVTENQVNGPAVTTTSYLGDQATVDPPVGGNTRSVVNRRGQTTRVELHNGPNLTSLEDAVDYTYTPLGQLETADKTLDTPDGSAEFTWSYGYDMVGRQIWAHDPDTGSTVTTYDDLGNPTNVSTGPIGVKDEVLNLNDAYHPAFEDPASSVITTTYDRLGRPLVKTGDTPDTNPETITSWTYDDAEVDNSIGQVTSVLQPIHSLYEGFLGAHQGDYTSNVIAYDPLGRATATSETYPRWITAEPASGSTVTKEYSTTYNKAGLPTAVTYPAQPGLPAATVNYTYTTGARLRSMTVAGTSPQLRLAQVTYNNIGRTSALTSGAYDSGTLKTGLRRTYTFDPDTGRFNTLKATITPGAAGGTSGTPYSAFFLDYTYDKVGNPTRIKGIATNPGGTEQTGYWCYDYDGLNRLTRAQTGLTFTPTECENPAAAPLDVVGDDAGYDLSYDHSGDRLATVTDNLHTVGGQNPEPLRIDYLTETANADENNDELGDAQRPHHNTRLKAQDAAFFTEVFNWPDAMATPGTIENDDQGRVKHWRPDLQLLDLADFDLTDDAGPQSSGYDYEYNSQGQLTRSKATLLGQEFPTLNSSSFWYAYGPDGTRLVRQRQFLQNGIQQERTIYLGDGTEISHVTFDAKTTSIRTFTTPAGTPIATQTSTTASGASGGTNQDAEWTWLAADAQGNLRLSYKHDPNNSSPPQRHHYYPYGDPVDDDRTPADDVGPNTPTGRGYLNKPHDRSGDIRLDHRNYSPNLNTLATPDPILDTSDPQSFNPYAYARNNPIADSDPTGLLRNERADGSGCGYKCVAQYYIEMAFQSVGDSDGGFWDYVHDSYSSYVDGEGNGVQEFKQDVAHGFVAGLALTGDAIWNEIERRAPALPKSDLFGAYSRWADNVTGRNTSDSAGFFVGIVLEKLVEATALRGRGVTPRPTATTSAPGVAANAVDDGAFRLIGANRAQIDPRKFTDYALNPSHPVGGNKARVFQSAFGFNRSNADDLIAQIRQGVMERTPIPGTVDKFGSRFTVDIPVTGPSGSGIVRTGWIYDPGSIIPRLTTAYPR